METVTATPPPLERGGPAALPAPAQAPARDARLTLRTSRKNSVWLVRITDL